MKKIIISVYMLLALAAYTVAQTTPVKKVTKTSTHKATVKHSGNSNANVTTKKETTTTQSEEKPATNTSSKTEKKVTKTVKKSNP